MKKSDLHKIVEEVLITNLEARDDDFELINNVYFNINKEIMKMSFNQVMCNHKLLGLPSIESITRVRRKIQAIHPELSSKKTREKRKKLEKEYENYYGKYNEIMKGELV